MRHQLLVYSLLLLTVSVFAQSDSVSSLIDSSELELSLPKEKIITLETGKVYTVKKIELQGTNRNKSAVLIRSGLAEGDKIKIPSEITREAIRKLWESKLFIDVKLYVKKIEGEEITLLFKFKETPQIGKIRVVKSEIGKSPSKSEREDLEGNLKNLTYRSYNPNVVFRATEIIKKYYSEEGKLYPKITHYTKNDTTKNNKLILFFEIDEGPKVKIEDIVFKGNRALPDSKLRKAMKETKRKLWWNVIRGAKFVEPEYIEDLKLVKAAYLQYGFRDMKVVSDSIIKTEDDKVKLLITVDEGKRYYFRKIRFTGNTKYTSEFLTKYLDIQKGDVYNEQRLQQRLSMDPRQTDVSSLYLDDGYLFFNLNTKEIKIENDSVDLEIQIFEGKQAIVGQITIVGNTKTSDHVILREIFMRPGDLFKRSDIIRSQQALNALRYFAPEKLQVNPKPNPANGTVDIEFVVEEQPSDQFELQGGFGAGRVVGTLGLSFNNFSTKRFWKRKYWTPVPSGDGQTLTLRAQSSGPWYQSYNFSFVEPWFRGKKPNALSTSVYHTRLQSTSTGGYQYITGATLGLGKRLKWPDNFFRVQYSLGYQRYNVFNYAGLNIATDQPGDFNNLNTKIKISRSSIDQPLYPRSGSEFNLIAQLTAPFVSLLNSSDAIKGMNEVDQYTWIEYHKYKFHAGWYNKIVDNLVLYSKVNFGILASYNKNIPISPFERFYMGGSGLTGFNIDGREIIPLRGFAEANSNNVVYEGDGVNGGVGAIKYTFELRYPISLEQQATIYALAFAEAGNTFASLRQFDPFDVKKAAGMGIRLYLPMLGMLGFDYGFPFDSANRSLDRSFNFLTPGQFTFTFGGNISGW
ncbi:MAG: outer membrane protein assembly factor BamA [Flavobacteriales bacterium]|nr:outer membrane protein assembly factor BamA [Flavobacteriales bacterium]